MRRNKGFFALAAVGVLSIVVLIAMIVPAAAQDDAPAQTFQAAVLEGTIGVIHADPAPGSGEQYQYFITLYQDDGTQTRLLMPLSQAQRHLAQRVRVYGQFVNQPQSSIQMHDNAVAVGSVGEVEGYTPQGRLHGINFTGNLRDILLLCHYSDSTVDLTENLAHFEDLVSDQRPGVSHYWRTVSYDNVNLSLSEVHPVRLVLPGTRAFYSANGGNVDALATDCVNAADAAINFADYDGIHLMLDGLDIGFALGGIHGVDTNDGSGFIRFTWIPPFGYRDQLVFAHEVGHTLGLLHSGGSQTRPRYPYDSFWDVMSSGSGREIDGTGDANFNGEFDAGESGLGFTATGTISYNLLALDYIDPARVVTVERGTSQEVTLERLLLPTDSTTPLMIVVPKSSTPSSEVNGLFANFYTVEARFANDYDQSIPPYEDNGMDFPENTGALAETDGNILIHDINSNNTNEAAIVVDDDSNDFVNDEGAIWRVGETFNDTGSDISIEVLEKTDTTFTVLVKNATDADPPPTEPVQIIVEPNQGRPTLTLVNEDAEWFNVWMGGTNGQILFDWFNKPGATGATPGSPNELSCEGMTCTITPDINPLGGTYEVWVSYWTSDGGFSQGGPLNIGWWGPEEFSLPTIPPDAVTGMTATVAAGGDVTLTWQGSERATWYNVWVGTPETAFPPFEQQFYAWALAENLGCENAGVCTFDDAVDAVVLGGDLNLPPGEYTWYLQSWGPGGFSEGGEFTQPGLEPWQTGPIFDVP